jgi:hypothetical protein
VLALLHPIKVSNATELNVRVFDFQTMGKRCTNNYTAPKFDTKLNSDTYLLVQSMEYSRHGREGECIKHVCGKSRRKKALGRLTCRYENNIKMDLRGIR